MTRKQPWLIRWLRAIPHRRYLLLLAVLFGFVWILLGIAPRDRGVWMLENSLVVLLVGAIAIFNRRILLSRISYTLIFLFLCAHEVGAHFTYAQVPYDDWFETFFGVRVSDALGWRRNHFDRLVHFLYGLLLAYPVREIFLRVANVRGFWGYFLPLDLTMSTSMLFELLEWGAAEVFGNGLGTAYLGTQSDPWDAHKDMALASTGALLAMTLIALINQRLQRDFAREWVESLRVKKPRPLGEVEAARMMSRK
jgi:putative membrane protein